MNPTDLTTLNGCLAELQDCSRGLAYMDHIYGRVIDRLDQLERDYDALESEAAFHARNGNGDSKLTATEIKARITSYIEAKPERVACRDECRDFRAKKVKMERWMRSLEKRLGAAQSASKGHEQMGRYGGGE